MTKRIQMLQELEEAHNPIILAALDAEARGASGNWGPRQILAHIVGWEVVAIDRLPQLLPAEAPAPLTYDALNKAMATVAGNQTVEMFRDMLYHVHEHFLRLPEVQNETSFVPGHPIYERTKAAIGHCLEHMRELDRL